MKKIITVILMLFGFINGLSFAMQPPIRDDFSYLRNKPFYEIDTNLSIGREYGDEIKDKVGYSKFNRIENIINRIIDKRIIKLTPNEIILSSGNTILKNENDVKIVKNAIQKMLQSIKNLNKLNYIIETISKKKGYKKGTLIYKLFGYIYYKDLLKIKSINKNIIKAQEAINKYNKKKNDLENILNGLDELTGSTTIQTNKYPDITDIENVLVNLWTSRPNGFNLYNNYYAKNWINNTHNRINLFYLGHAKKDIYKNVDLNISCQIKSIEFEEKDDYDMAMPTYGIKNIGYEYLKYSGGPSYKGYTIPFSMENNNNITIIKFNLKNIDLTKNGVVYITLNREIEELSKYPTFDIRCNINKVRLNKINKTYYPRYNNKFNVTIKNIKLKAWCLTTSHQDGYIKSSRNKVYLYEKIKENGKWKNGIYNYLGTFSDKAKYYTIKYDNTNRPINGYDIYKRYRGTRYDGLSERCMYASSSLNELTAKLVKGKIYKYATTFDGNNLNRNDNFWTVFIPKPAIKEIINFDYY